MVPLPSNVMESWMNARSFYVVVELSIVESMFTRHKHEIWKHGCTIRVSYPIHIRYDTAYLIIHPRIGFSMRPVSYWPDTRIRYISNTCPASCVFLPHLKINRYNGNFLHNGNTFLTFFRRDEDRDFFYFFFFGFFLFAVHFGRPYRAVLIVSDTRIVANCFYLVVSNRIHVSTYRIRRVEGLGWHIVQLWSKAMTWATIVSFKFTGFKIKYHGVWDF